MLGCKAINHFLAADPIKVEIQYGKVHFVSSVLSGFCPGLLTGATPASASAMYGDEYVSVCWGNLYVRQEDAKRHLYLQFGYVK
jgi:hypothetical protein